MSPFPRLRSRALHEAWWVAALAVVAVGLFSVGLDVDVRCRLHGCDWSRDRWFGLDSIGGLPRLFTSGLFVAVAVAGAVAARRAAGRPRAWWATVAVLGAALAVFKVLSTHSQLKSGSAIGTLVGSVALSVVALAVLWRSARRWGVRAGQPVVVALGVYAFAALGLDAVSSLVATLHGGTGAVLEAVSTFVEELGEALAALLVLTAVWWRLPSARLPK